MDLDITYENMNNLSEFIKEQSSLFLEQVELYNLKLEELATYWKGPDKEYFVNEVKLYQHKFYKLKDILDDYSSLILDISKNNRDLELHIKNKVSEL